MLKRITAFGLLVAGISGCNSADIPRNNLPDRYYQPAPTLSETTTPLPVISIRYPAGIEPQHRDAIATLYADHTPYMARMADQKEQKMVAKFKRQLDVNPKALQQSLEKTSFYALYLYQAMQDQLGDNAHIVLEPTVLTLDSNGKLSQERPYPGLPADICMNFLSYVDPYFHPGTWSGLPATYGKGIAPIVSLRMDQATLADSNGLYAATTRLMNGTQSVQADTLDCDGVSADVFSLLNRSQHWSQDSKTHYSTVVPQQYPYFILKMDNFDERFPAADYLKVFALDSQRLLSELPSSGSLIGAARYGQFIAGFDPPLAQRWQQHSLAPGDDQALADIESFRLALADFAVAKSQVHFDLYLATDDFPVNQAKIMEEAKILRNANLLTGLKIAKNAFITDPLKLLNAANVSADELASSKANLYLLSGYKETAVAAAGVSIPVSATLNGKPTSVSATSMESLISQLQQRYRDNHPTTQ